MDLLTHAQATKKETLSAFYNQRNFPNFQFEPYFVLYDYSSFQLSLKGAISCRLTKIYLYACISNQQ